MTGLKRTELRHQMLADVAAGKVLEVHGKWAWSKTVPVSTATARVLTELATASLIQARDVNDNDPAPWGAINIQAAGRELLSEWDTKYGKVET